MFAGEDFVGEIDLARSEFSDQPRIQKQRELSQQHLAVKLNQLTSSACLSFFFALQNLFLELPIPFLIFLISFVVQFLDTLQEVVHILRTVHSRGRHTGGQRCLLDTRKHTHKHETGPARYKYVRRRGVGHRTD